MLFLVLLLLELIVYSFNLIFPSKILVLFSNLSILAFKSLLVHNTSIFPLIFFASPKTSLTLSPSLFLVISLTFSHALHFCLHFNILNVEGNEEKELHLECSLRRLETLIVFLVLDQNHHWEHNHIFLNQNTRLNY